MKGTFSNIAAGADLQALERVASLESTIRNSLLTYVDHQVYHFLFVGAGVLLYVIDG